MLLLRNSLVVVVVVVVVVLSVWVESSWAKSDFHPIFKHFHIYGCTNKTIVKPYIKAKHFKKTSGLYIGVRDTTSDSVNLRSESSPPCKLQTDALFHTSSTLEGDPFTMTFEVVSSNTKEHAGSDSMTGILEVESAKAEGREEAGVKEEREGESLICNASVGDQLTLDSGYAFISCPGDPIVITKMWREWQESVKAAEEKTAELKRKVLLGVTCGPAALVFLIVVCALYRLRSSPDPNLRRRPSATSGIRTGSTHDHHSTRT